MEGLCAEPLRGAEEDRQFLWKVLWAQTSGMDERQGRVAAQMLEFYREHGEFPSVRALAEAIQSTHGVAERNRTAVLQTWRRALRALDFLP